MNIRFATAALLGTALCALAATSALADATIPNAVLDTDMLDGNAALSRNIGKLQAHVAGYFTGEYLGSRPGGENYEIGASYPLLQKLSGVGVADHQNVDHDFHDDTWNLGLRYALRKGDAADRTLGRYRRHGGRLGRLGAHRWQLCHYF